MVDDGAGAGGAIDARLADGGRILHPDPLAAFIFPEIVERAIACGVVALTAEEPKISAGVGPSGGTPARAGNIGGGSNALGSINAGLIDDVCAAHPGPYASFEFPQVVQCVWAARGIEVKSAEKPEIARAIEPPATVAG